MWLNRSLIKHLMIAKIINPHNEEQIAIYLQHHVSHSCGCFKDIHILKMIESTWMRKIKAKFLLIVRLS